MKAVVVEVKKHYAAVLSDDGSFKTIKNNNYEVGQIIQLMNRKVFYTKKLITIAASAAAFIILSVGTWAYASPYLYISVDVNPSIEYTVNRFDRVLTVKAVNDDGEEMIDIIALKDLKNKKIKVAIAETVKQITRSGYFNGNTEGGIIITTASENDDKADELADTLHAITEQEISDDTAQEVDIEAYSVGLDRVEDARELGVTPGKLNLVEKLQAAAANSADINLEEWLNKPVKDIMKATKEYKIAATTSSSENSTQKKNQKKSENREEKLQNEKDKASVKENKAQNKLERDKTVEADQGKQITGDQDNTDNQSKKKSNQSKQKSDTNPSRDNLPQDTTPEPSDNSVSQEHSDKANSDNSNKSDRAVNQSDNSSSQSDNAAKQSVPLVEKPVASAKQSANESDKKGNSGNKQQGSEQGSRSKDH